ncbi:MAG TPA: hypothetical protein VIL88_10585 [Devosia sp.]|jgi:hypothetical protein|uniref:hypothetical protein n=1 Tax=Devosia sp. TaxID=1871048 RepID=UPI002F9547E1
MALWGKLIAGTVLLITLGGCVDARVQVDVLDAETAHVIITQAVGAEVYGMIKLRQAAAAAEAKAQKQAAPAPLFCQRGQLTEKADGSATCVLEETGDLAMLSRGPEGRRLELVAGEAGQVRVSLPISALRAVVAQQRRKLDEEMQASLPALLAQASVTLQVSGGAVIRTNMVESANGKKAEQRILLRDVLTENENLPAQYFAVVQAP